MKNAWVSVGDFLEVDSSLARPAPFVFGGLCAASSFEVSRQRDIKKDCSIPDYFLCVGVDCAFSITNVDRIDRTNSQHGREMNHFRAISEAKKET